MELFRAIELAPNGDIGLSDYPIFDANYRDGLNKKIIAHYHSREIGMETVDRFIFAMRRRMNEIMPYYNDLYKTQKIEFDPLSTMDIRTVTSGDSNVIAEGEATSESATNNEGGSRAVQSNTPQVLLAGNGDYATSAADTNSKSKASGTGKETNKSSNTQTNSGDSRVSGYQGSPASIIAEYRRNLINIDMLVIDDLSDLFMGVWDNGDDYAPFGFPDLPTL